MTKPVLRALQAVKSVLVEAGADPAPIICVGLGRADNGLRVNDLDDNGNLVSEQNRAVFLLQKATAEALEVSTNE